MLPIQEVEKLAGCEKSRCMQCTVCICGKMMEEMKRERERERNIPAIGIIPQNITNTAVSDPQALNSSLKSIPWEVVQVHATPICLSFFPCMYICT